MPARSRLQNALSAIDDAVRKLKRVRDTVDPSAQQEIRRAIRELNDAESAVRSALSDIDE